MNETENKSMFSGLITAFLKGNLSILLMIISIAAGIVALMATPREEEPQIVVPVADVLVSYPGGSAEEVERLVASRLEKLLYQIDGVEYVYSMSRPGMAVVTVRFFVGEDREESLIKLYNKIFQNVDQTTPGIAGWVVKPVEIDDVPIVNATLFSSTADSHQLRRVAEEVAHKLQQIPNTSRVTVHGGERREVRVALDAQKLAAHSLSPLEVAGALKVSNSQMASGSFERNNAEVLVETGPFLRDVEDVRNLLVGAQGGKPVYLRDVAVVSDGPEELKTYTRIGFGPGEKAVGELPAVTIAVSKKKGSNAVWVSRDVEKMLGELKGSVIPDNISARITRDNGETANEKVNGLVKGLGEAVVTVIALIWIMMNWRVGIIVAIAVPITYGLTLLANYMLGYTINRVTLFALILTLGLLVDDPIVGVENIHRHLGFKKKSRFDAIRDAMNEVLPPIVIATLAVVVVFLPMFFITGMMGPYMRPMAVNVPIAMLASMLVSLTITPWLSNKILKADGGEAHGEDVSGTRTYRIYRRIVEPLVTSRRKAKAMLWITAGLFMASLSLIVLGLVPLKMLPFDNKNELQLVIDLPEGATLEKTDAAVRDFENYLRSVNEVSAFVSTVGESSPMDFNGMVRHYYLRQGANLADIRLNLLPKHQREQGSHAIALRLRHDLEAIASKHDAKLKIVESPPGPPVLSTVVAEIYGQAHHTYDELIAAAKTVEQAMMQTKGVVDTDTTVEENQQKLFFRVDRSKAALGGVATDDIVNTMRLALGGMNGGTVHAAGERNELPITLRLPREDRSSADRLASLNVKGRGGNLVQVGELGKFEAQVQDKTIMHKNLRPVVFVTAEMAGRGPAYAVLDLQKHFTEHPLPAGIEADWSGEGEWKITIDVFRDLGIAFAAALLGIYVLLVYQTGSFALPGIIMLSIPLTMIGIMPGFALLNLIANKQVGGFDNPVFFTATAMIGMIALAGIVVRNGIILIDFIQHNVARGVPLRQAIIESGAVRFRPIFLTAGAAMLGAWPITLDPIFSGLAWSLIFGLFVSTAFTLVVIPTVYGMIYGKNSAESSTPSVAEEPKPHVEENK